MSVIFLNANIQDNLGKCDDTQEPKVKLFGGKRI